MRITEGEIKFVLDNYGTMPYKEMAAILGIKYARVKVIAKKHVPVRVVQGTSIFSRKGCTYTSNEDYFNVLTDDCCYWAGFIAADGCIIDKCQGQKLLRISLQSGDIGHLEKFKKAIEFNGVVAVYSANYTYKGLKQIKKSCNIQIKSNKLCDALLENFSITPRKSLTIVPPSANLTHSQRVSFLKGYIDGDGYVMPKTSNQWSSHVSLLGTLEMVTWLKGVIEDVIGEDMTEKCIAPRSSKNTYSLTITSRKARLLLVELGSMPLGLDRKWEGVAEAAISYKDPRIKFSMQEVAKILNDIKLGVKQRTIANEYGVHQVSISQILLRKTKWLKDTTFDSLYIQQES